MARRIAYFSGTRADFGLMRPVLQSIEAHPELDLLLYVTGMHLMPEFGESRNDVRSFFPDVRSVDAVYPSDAPGAIADFLIDFFPLAMRELQRERPDIVLVLGDRSEMLAVAMACVYLQIPVAHLHGGEITGSVDEIARHAITKLAHIHFPATEESAHRLQQMGEERERIFVVGAPALDVILNEQLPTREELFSKLGVDASQDVILVTQHPVTGEEFEAARQMESTLEAVKQVGLPVVVIYPNADPGGRAMIDVIERERMNPSFHLFRNLSHREFLALEREAAVWVGNSSGAMIESSSFQTPVVNIGTRQLGRQCGENVLHVSYDRTEIVAAIERALHDDAIKMRVRSSMNPWGDGKTGERIVSILATHPLEPRLLLKRCSL